MSANTTTDRLTATAIKQAKPGRTLSDAHPHRGLRLTVSAAGTKTFVYRYRSPVTNQLRQFKLGRYPAIDLAKARDLHRKLQRMREQGVDPADALEEKRQERVRAAVQAKRAAYTVGDLVADYQREHVDVRRKRPEVTGQILSAAMRDFPDLAATPAADVTRAQVQAVIDEKSRSAPAVARAVRQELGAAFERAIARDRLPQSQSNPCDKVEVVRKKSRERSFTNAEIATFLAWLPAARLSDNVRDALHLTLLTGCRSGEAVAARWEDISLDLVPGSAGSSSSSSSSSSSEWRMPETKNGTPHTVFLSRQAADLLQARRDASRGSSGADPRSAWVFPSRRVSGHIGQKAIRTEVFNRRGTSGLATWVAHDLRRTVGTGLARLGAPRQVADRILNHTDSSVSGIYDRYSYDTDAREWWQRWADHLDGLRAPQVVPMRRLAG